MIPGLTAILPLLFSLVGVDPAPGVRSIIYQEQVIVRVPVRPLPPPKIVWRPKQAVKCVKIGAIRGAALVADEQIDILLKQQRRVRALFAANCPTLDFYGGFYLKPVDGRVCAGRDVVYSRIGGNCRIERMQLLEPRLKQSVP